MQLGLMRIALVLLVCTLAGPVVAQPQFGMGSVPKFVLFLDPAVREELKLKKEQEFRINEIMEEMEGNAEGGKVVIRVGPGGGADLPDFDKMETQLLAVLDDAQKKRFNQIWLQRRGLLALRDKEIANQVGLNDEQKGLVEDIHDYFESSMQKMVQEMFEEAGGGGFRLDEKKAREIREKSEKSIKDLLTPEQEKKWEALLGPKFEAKKS